MIKIICGAVKSGKSRRLIEYYEQLKDCGTYVFSSKFSLTNGENVVSRYGTKIKAIPINSLFDIPCHINGKNVKHILIDEFQFLQMTSEELKAFFDKYYYDYDFYIFGLNLDYTRKPFKLMANAMAMADVVEIVHGYCDICKNEDSKYSLRLENDKPANIKEEGQVILLDGEYNDIEVKYLSVGDNCWKNIYYKEN